jgi:hypothetical protein
VEENSMPQLTGTADAGDNYGVKGEDANPLPPPPTPGQLHPAGVDTVVAGVWGDSLDNTGVAGTSTNGTAVWGGSQPTLSADRRVTSYGRFGFFGGLDPVYSQDAGACGVSAQQGVFGHSTGATGTGVYGNGYYALRGDSPNGTGFIGGIDPKYRQKAGLYGSSDQQGVIGASTGGHGTAIYGDSTDGSAIRGETTVGTAIQGTAFDGGYAAQLNGAVQVANGDLTLTTGNVVIMKGDVQLQSGDCAEDFDVAVDEGVPGTVMVLGENGKVAPCTQAYDRRVAGVVSGAGDLKPGILLGRRSEYRPKATIALVGTVYCKVDARERAIEVGDLLTTSAVEGHAMKALDRDRAFGAVIGKAMRALLTGQGLIPVLIALQ